MIPLRMLNYLSVIDGLIMYASNEKNIRCRINYSSHHHIHSEITFLIMNSNFLTYYSDFKCCTVKCITLYSTVNMHSTVAISPRGYKALCRPKANQWEAH